MTATDSIRIRVTPDFKDEVSRMYAQRGTTVSAAVRSFLQGELDGYRSAVDAFDSIMASADRKLAASGLPEPSVDDIAAYVSQMRAERAREAMVSA